MSVDDTYLPNTRSEAKAQGLKVFRSFRFCFRPRHGSVRLVTTGECKACADARKVKKETPEQAAARRARERAAAAKEAAKQEARKRKAEEMQRLKEERHKERVRRKRLAGLIRRREAQEIAARKAAEAAAVAADASAVEEVRADQSPAGLPVGQPAPAAPEPLPGPPWGDLGAGDSEAPPW